MRALITISCMCCFSFLFAGQGQVFHAQQHRLKVFYGDTVAILADSAYIISAAQALLLNEKLLALQTAQRTNSDLFQSNTVLLSHVKAIEKQVTKLLQRMQSDQQLITGNLSLLLSELDQSISFLQQTNEELETNNQALQEQLNQMDATVKHLRQTNHRMAWQNTRDKVVIALVALGLGFFFGGL